MVPVWQPVLARDLTGRAAAPTRHALAPVSGLESDRRARIERRADELGLQPLRWPQTPQPDTLVAMLAATFAQQAGRVVAYSLAAFRQAFAAGRDLGVTDNVLIAAAACELHPRAVLRAVESRSVRDRLARATAEAARLGVRAVPTVLAAGALFAGEQRLDAAVDALAERTDRNEQG